MNKRISTIIADDHPMIRDGYRSLLKGRNDIYMIGAVSNGEELISMAASRKPDVIFTDIHMPVINGVVATRAVKNMNPDVKVIAYTMLDDDQYVRQMLEAGVDGYLLKDCLSSEMVDAAKAVYNGKKYYCAAISGAVNRLLKESKKKSSPEEDEPIFNTAEYQIIVLLCEQLATKEIAARTHYSIKTVQSYRHSIMQKIGAKNMVGVVMYAIRKGFIKKMRDEKER